MPLIRSQAGLCHFAHLPKCGGSSIEGYLQRNGAGMALYDNAYLSVPKDQRWNRTSPQHIDGASLGRIMGNFVDFGFAITRDPIKRFMSAFYFQAYQEKTLPVVETPNSFALSLATRSSAAMKNVYDNHFLPQSELLIPGVNYRLFRLEDGMSEVKQFIDAFIFGRDVDDQIRKENVGRHYKAKYNLSQEAEEALRTFYAKDYQMIAEISQES